MDGSLVFKKKIFRLSSNNGVNYGVILGQIVSNHQCRWSSCILFKGKGRGQCWIVWSPVSV